MDNDQLAGLLNGGYGLGSSLSMLQQLAGQNSLTNPPIQSMPPEPPNQFGQMQPDSGMQMQEQNAIPPELAAYMAQQPVKRLPDMDKDFTGQGLGATAPSAPKSRFMNETQAMSPEMILQFLQQQQLTQGGM